MLNFKKVRSFIKNRDMFGRPIYLSFGKDGDRVNTVFGGIISIIIQIYVWYVLIFKIGCMLMKEFDTIIIYETQSNFEDIGEVSLKKANITPFIRFIDPITDKPLEIDLKGIHQNVFFLLMSKDLETGKTVKTHFRYCNNADFLGSQYNLEERYNEVNNSMLCPDDLSKLKLKNSRYANSDKERDGINSINFMIMKCFSTPGGIQCN